MHMSRGQELDEAFDDARSHCSYVKNNFTQLFPKAPAPPPLARGLPP